MTPFLQWLKKECKDWRTFVVLLVVCIILSLPIWLGYLLGFIFHWEWAFWVSTALWGFWLLPGAPFLAVAASLTLSIKKIWEKKEEKDKNKSEDDSD